MTQREDRTLTRTRLESADLAAAWERNAPGFVAWARRPDHDSYWHFHLDLFFEFVPPPAETGVLIERLREPVVPDHASRKPHSRRWQRPPLFCTCVQ
jgi:hypothetical protein